MTALYTASGQPGDHAPGASAAIRSEFELIEQAFSAFPDVDVSDAGFFLRVNVSGTAYEAVDANTVFVPIAGGTMTGTLKSTNATAMRLVNNGGFIEAYNTAETTRTGYLQFNDAGSVLLRALAPASAGIVLQTATGTLTLDQTAAATLNGPSFDVTRAAGVAASLNLRGNNNAAATGVSLAQGIASEGTLYNKANSYLALGTNNTERIRVLADGRVGIGTNVPSNNLDVRQDSGNGPVLALTNRSINGSTHRYGALLFSGYRDVADPCYGGGVWGEGTSAASNSTDLVFGAMTNNSAGTMPTERMRITAAGDVGIGGTPNAYGAGNTGLTLNAAVTPVFDLNVNGTRTATFDATAAQAVLGTITNVPLTFYQSGTERARLSPTNGNLLVKSTTDTNSVFSLQVGDGTADTRSLFAQNNAFSIGVRQGAVGNYYIGASAAAACDLLFSNTSGTRRLTLTDDGRLYGSALHNNAGAVTGATNQHIASGTYTPTAANVTNATSISVQQAQWMRVGNVVTVTGRMTVGATAAAPTNTQLRLTLPIASNFTAEENGMGTMCRYGFTVGGPNEPGLVLADAATDNVVLSWVASSTGAVVLGYTYTYLIQ